MWISAILDPDFPRLHIAVQQRIDSKPVLMSTAGGVKQEVDKGVRILSLGKHIVFPEILAMTLTVEMKIMEALERTPNF
jgi:hypothetical protein